MSPYRTNGRERTVGDQLQDIVAGMDHVTVETGGSIGGAMVTVADSGLYYSELVCEYTLRPNQPAMDNPAVLRALVLSVIKKAYAEMRRIRAGRFIIGEVLDVMPIGSRNTKTPVHAFEVIASDSGEATLTLRRRQLARG